MSSKINITQQAYSYIENHGHAVKDYQLSLICKILEVDLDFIIQFHPSRFFELIQSEQNNFEKALNIKNDKDEVILALKAQITQLKENVYGLRKQNRELNELVMSLKEVLFGNKHWRNK